ncbi:hypothetical protein GJ496_007144 [Pomphorhynchus laevis]|nr:hypothetical protein GJ496_007144 [Pomphorhynchus laevis]
MLNEQCLFIAKKLLEFGRTTDELINLEKAADILSDPQSFTLYLGLSLEDFCAIICPYTFSNDASIRTTAFYILYKCYSNDMVIKCIYSYHIDYIIARAITTRNDMAECTTVMKLVFKIINCSTYQATSVIAAALISAVQHADQETVDDKIPEQLFVLSLCELINCHPQEMVNTSAISSLLNYALKITNLQLVEAITLSVVSCLEKIPLYCSAAQKNFFAPFTTIFVDPISKCENRYSDSCSIALRVIASSWAGRFYMITNDSNILIFICQSLTSENEHKQEFAMKVLYNLIGLDYEYSNTRAPNRPPALLGMQMTKPYIFNPFDHVTGYLAGEAFWKLPTLLKFRPNLYDCSMAFLLQMLIRARFIEACSEMILQCPFRLRQSATILLSEVLLQCFRLLSFSQNFILLPILITRACCSMNPNVRERAHNCMVQINQMEENTKQAYFKRSIFLNSVILLEKTGSLNLDTPSFTNLKLLYKTVKPTREDDADSISCSDTASKNSLALQTMMYLKDPRRWQWKRVLQYVETVQDSTKSIEENHPVLLQILGFYHLNNVNGFALVSQSDEIALDCVAVAINMVKITIETQSKFLMSELKQIINEFCNECQQMLSSNSSIMQTMSLNDHCISYYYLLFGIVCLSSKLSSVVKPVIDSINKMIENGSDTFTEHIIFALSSLPYNQFQSRQILRNALNSNSKKLRTYSIELLRVLLRLHHEAFSEWCIDLLVNYMDEDTKHLVESILDEAFTVEKISCTIVEDYTNVWKSLNTFLRARAFGIESSCKLLRKKGLLDKDLILWNDIYNQRYVEHIEAMLTDYFYINKLESVNRDAHLLYTKPHLFQELCKHDLGFKIVSQQPSVKRAIDILMNPYETDVQQIKRSMWIMGNIGSTEYGSQLCTESIINKLVNLAEESYSVEIRSIIFKRYTRMYRVCNLLLALTTISWINVESGAIEISGDAIITEKLENTISTQLGAFMFALSVRGHHTSLEMLPLQAFTAYNYTAQQFDMLENIRQFADTPVDGINTTQILL